jgi:two-component system NtrC family sensor kinase
MSVRFKLLLIITFVALVPLSILAYTILGLHQAAFEETLAELHARSAKYGAKIVETKLEGALASLRPLIADSIRWPELSEPERQGALWLVYGQLSSIVSVELVDAQGQPIGVAARTDATGKPEYAGRLETSANDALQLRAAVRLEQGAGHELLRGEPLLLSDARTLALPVAFRVDGNAQPWFVVVGLALSEVCAELGRERLEKSVVLLLTKQGRRLCAPSDGAGPTRSDAQLLASAGPRSRNGVRYNAEDKREMLAAVAVTPWEFCVVVAQPTSQAFASSIRMRQESILWIAIGVLAALGAGLLLARGINEPLLRLTRGAERVAGGDFAVRLAIDGNDELAELSASFNRMCGEIEKRQQEIQGWNEELRARVEDKAGQLKLTQNALLESRKIAAMTALGAGVAHEINNPLTGVIGLTQVLIGRFRKAQTAPAEVEMLVSVEREALRVRDIVQRMLKLSQSHESTELSELRPGELLRNVLNARRAALTLSGISIEEAFSIGVPSILGHREQLAQVFEELIDNAAKAMRAGHGTLSVTAESLDNEVVRLCVVDTGKGILPEHLDKVFDPFFTTKDDWQGQGLGLTAAYRVIEAHHGTIKLDSQPGRGTTVTIALPAMRDGAHLQ